MSAQQRTLAPGNMDSEASNSPAGFSATHSPAVSIRTMSIQDATEERAEEPHVLAATSPAAHSGPHRTNSFSADISGESEVPTRRSGPLNQDITMGPRRQLSTSSEGSMLSVRTGASSLPAFHDYRTVPTEQQQQQAVATATPTQPQSTYKPRVRKVHTKEAPPKDDSALITLGMGPFMIGQDAMANQNRLVRNEAIFASRFLDLKRSVQGAEAMRVDREQNIYRILTEHGAVLNRLSAAASAGAGAAVAAREPAAPATTSLRADPDFAALLAAHAEMRTRLDRLAADVLASTLKTQSALAGIEARIDDLAACLPCAYAPTPPSTPALLSEPLAHLFTPRAHAEGSATVELSLQRKRRREEAGIADARPQSQSQSQSQSPRTPLFLESIESCTDVIYGPISQTSPVIGSTRRAMDDASSIRTIAAEAVRDVGLDARSALRGVRRAYDDPAFLALSFTKAESAARFVELVGLGRDGHTGRQARLADANALQSTGDNYTRRHQGGYENLLSEKARGKLPAF